MQIFFWILIVVLGYWLGNINGAIIISKVLMKDDVRSHGSGNAGLTNFFRTYGGFQSLLVILLDAGKCVAACLIARDIINVPEYRLLTALVAGSATILGHSYPAAAGFRGGKGIMCGAALAACADWRVFVLILSVFIVTLILTKYVSLGSVLAATAFAAGFLVFHWGNWAVCILAVTTAAFVIFRHRTNIVRLLKGTESKLTFRKK